MKKTLICIMRAEIRAFCFTWGYTCMLGDSKFSPLCMCLNDCESTASIHFLNKITNFSEWANTSANNADWLYIHTLNINIHINIYSNMYIYAYTYTLTHTFYVKKFWPEEKMYYNWILRLINTEVQKTFCFHFLCEYFRNTVGKAHFPALALGRRVCLWYVHTRVCRHMFIYVYIWRFCGVWVHLLSTYLLSTSFDAVLRSGNRNVNKACVIPPSGAYSSRVGDGSERGK